MHVAYFFLKGLNKVLALLSLSMSYFIKEAIRISQQSNFLWLIFYFVKQLVTGDPQMKLSPTLTVVADLQTATYSVGTTTKKLTGTAGEIINFTDKPASYDMLAEKIYNDFVWGTTQWA